MRNLRVCITCGRERSGALPPLYLLVILAMTDDRSEQARALLEAVGDRRATLVSTLDQRRRDLKREQQNISKVIKLENRKRHRLLEKARGLSDTDLLSAVATRAAAKAKAKAKARAMYLRRVRVFPFGFPCCAAGETVTASMCRC